MYLFNANNKGAGQSKHPYSLINTFVVCNLNPTGKATLDLLAVKMIRFTHFFLT